MSLPSYLLTHTVSIERKVQSSTKNSVGKYTETLTSIDSAASCLIQPHSDRVIIEKKGKSYVSTHYGYFQYTEDILEGDIVTHGTQKYIVMAPQNEGGQDNHYRVLLRTVD